MPHNHQVGPKALDDEPSSTEPILQSRSSNYQSCTRNDESSTAASDEGDIEDIPGHPKGQDDLRALRAKLKYIVPAVSIGIFLSAADQTIIVSSYGQIGSDLKALNKSSWISTSYFLTLTSFQPLYGKLSDIFGRKAALLFAYLIFAIGCLCCGLAQTMDQLIAARAFTGIGGGGMTTVVSILMSDIVPLRERGTWQGLINIIFAAGAGSGAPLGGFLSDAFSWRWAFLGQVPFCLLAFLSVGLLLRLPQREVVDWKTKLRRIDFLGAFILVVTVFCLLFGLDRGVNVAWSAPISIVPLSLFLPLAAAFLYNEFRLATEPFAPAHIIINKSLVACYLGNFFGFGAYMAVLFYVPLYFQAVEKMSASQAGARLLPAIIAGVFGSLGAGLIMQRTGRYYWMTLVAYSTSFVFTLAILLSIDLGGKTTVAMPVALALAALGNGSAVTTTLIGLIANASSEDQAVATACSYLFRSLGSVVGLSLSAAVVQNTLRNELTRRLHGTADIENIVRHIRESLEYVNKLSPRVQEVARLSYGTAVRSGFMLMTLLAFGSVLSSVFIKEKRLER